MFARKHDTTWRCLVGEQRENHQAPLIHTRWKFCHAIVSDLLHRTQEANEKLANFHIELTSKYYYSQLYLLGNNFFLLKCHKIVSPFFAIFPICDVDSFKISLNNLSYYCIIMCLFLKYANTLSFVQRLLSYTIAVCYLCSYIIVYCA